MNTIDDLQILQQNQKQSREREEQEKAILRQRIEDESSALTECDSEIENMEKQLQERKQILVNKRISLTDLEKQIDQERKARDRIKEEWEQISLQIEKHSKVIEELRSKKEREAQIQADLERKTLEIEKQLSVTKESLATMTRTMKQLEDQAQSSRQQYSALEKHIDRCKEERSLQSTILSNPTLQRLLLSTHKQRECTYP